MRRNLISVHLPDGRHIEYVVDRQDRRVAKRVDGVLVQQWLWSSHWTIAAELDGAGHLASRFVYGTRPLTPEFVVRSGATYRVISDHLGSVRALVNIVSPTDIPVRLDYDVFGAVSGTCLRFIPQGFAGGLFDPDTGLVRFGVRDYDPVAGRWTTKDPALLAGGVNPYGYAANDPVN